MTTERSLVLVKPDGFSRGLTGAVLARIERKGYRLVALEIRTPTRELLIQHYAEHEGKPFFNGLVEYITSAPVVAMVLEGTDAVKSARTTMGVTNPAEAAPGSIRGDFGLERGRNLVHGSDSPENGIRESELFFRPEEIVAWTRSSDSWIFE